MRGPSWKLFNKLDLKALAALDAEAAAKSTVEKAEVDRESDAVIILAGDSVVVEESLLAELGDGLDAVAGEEVVEEDGVVACQVELAHSPDLVQGRNKP